VNRSKQPILGGGRFAGVEPGIFCGIFYRLGSAWMRRSLDAARLGKGIFSGIFGSSAGGSAFGAARLGVTGLNMARVDVTRLLPLARVGATGLQSPDLQVARVAHPGVRLS